MPLLVSDLYEIAMTCCSGTLSKFHIEWKKNTWAVGVVLVSSGYPGSYSKEIPIKGEAQNQTCCTRSIEPLFL